MRDWRRKAPAVERNREPILQVLQRILPPRGLVLEIASGTGEHCVFLAQALPSLTFQPSDPDPANLQTIEAWRAHAGLANALPALPLDASAPAWPVGAVDAVVCINMIHISPWAASEGLMRGAAGRLAVGAPLYLYGPYLRDGVETAPGNLNFDADLRRRNPEWGLRQLADISSLAALNGFGPPEVTDMPANNISVVFRRI